MPIDGVVVRNIVTELNEKLSGGRVDKISQPEVDEIIITVRNKGENYRLLLSSSPNYPRVHLTYNPKQNPINAPMFCMVLRKHLSGGRITGIVQYNLDRIIKIYIESYDELGNLTHKVLICEIMGRHSNIILISDNTNTIIDSIKHITIDMSSYRQILPNLNYKYPPMQDKLDPLIFQPLDLLARVDAAPANQKLEKFISGNISGLSKLAAREICFTSGLDSDSSISAIDKAGCERLVKSASSFVADITTNAFTPCIYYDNSNLYDFYCFNLKHLNLLHIHEILSISDTIEQFYHVKDKADRVRQKSSDILKVVNTNLERCLKKLSIQEEKLIECSHKDRRKLCGDLIMANLYNIQKGENKAVVQNFYDESQSTIEIPLDMTLTPVENAQKYYKKYNKEKNAETIVRQQKDENLSEIDYLENQLVNLNNCTEDDEIEEIRNELISLGYVKRKKRNGAKKHKQSKPLHYVSSDGANIYVGKNNIQNDYLTTKFADSTDIWMHTKNIHGSHVIIKADNRPVSDEAILEGAILAAYYSKARDSSNVPVDFTEKKNVKKPSGAKPGMVIYYTNRTVFVTPDEGQICKLEIKS